MRKKLTYLGLGLALTVTALVAGPRPAQATTGCITYYCNSVGCCYSCCFYGGRSVCTEPCAPDE
jgi:hypothetical protein